MNFLGIGVIDVKKIYSYCEILFMLVFFIVTASVKSQKNGQSVSPVSTAHNVQCVLCIDSKHFTYCKCFFDIRIMFKMVL